MKKLISVILALALFVPAVACADLPDISGLSFEELAALSVACQRAMWDHEEWEEVRVPAGVYLVGRDIPAGKWSIRTESKRTVSIKIGTALNDVETDIDNSTFLFGQMISNDVEKERYPQQIDVSLRDSIYIVFTRDVLFCRYTGKNRFDFK